jgi:hypothetical protein
MVVMRIVKQIRRETICFCEAEGSNFILPRAALARVCVGLRIQMVMVMKIRPYPASLVLPMIAVIALLVAPLGVRGAEARGGFIHPGGLHTREDLERMRTHVAAGDHPWIDSWNALLENPKVQLKYKPAPRRNLGVSRQRYNKYLPVCAMRWLPRR